MIVKVGIEVKAGPKYYKSFTGRSGILHSLSTGHLLSS